MPKLWAQTIEEHRREVREAILETTRALVAEHGLLSVTMSQIAEAVGIGRATVYKYFPDVEAVLLAWHQSHVAAHLAHLRELRDQPGQPSERLEAVLQAYALIAHYRQRHGAGQLAALLHRGEQVELAQRQLSDLFEGLLNEVAQSGAIRVDVEPNELASYCLHALAAAATVSSTAAVDRLVTLTLAGLRPSR